MLEYGVWMRSIRNETFRKSFTNGRSMYFDDSEYESPHVAHDMSTLLAVGSVLDEDGKGGHCFDRMAFKNPIDILGFFLGYMSDPILAEIREEREDRHKRVVI
jgi:hypothetical protein